MKQPKASRGTVTPAPADIETLRPGEEPLGSLIPAEKSWLATAFASLARIYVNREPGSPGNGAFCVFAFGKIYVQFLASSDAERILCEAVSEKSIPDIGSILMTEGDQALIRLGFKPPEISPNYSQTLLIEGSRDLGYAVRLAFRVLKNVYRVADFSSAVFKERIPKSTAERKREAERQAVCNALEWFDDTIATLEDKAHRLRDLRERFVHMLGREESPESAELVGWYVGAASQSLGLARFDLAFSRGIELANTASSDGGPERTSAGVPWSEVPEFARPHVAWIDGRHGSAQETLPSVDDVPVPGVLNTLPFLHEDRPRGSQAMIDAAGARARLRDVRPGAWLISPYTGSKWAKWPSGDVGWLPADVELPAVLQVAAQNDIP